MDDFAETQSLSDFVRNATENVERIQETGRPIVLTVNGKAKLVVLDAAAYQLLFEHTEERSALAGIRRGLADIKRGRTRPAHMVLDDIRKRRKIPRKS